MKAEIISIGSELTSGQNLDTNSQWLSLRLMAMGIPVRFHTTLADDLAENVAALRFAANRANLVLLTGGLGPTQDDLTREALAQLAGVPLEFHAESLGHIMAMFAKRNRVMPDRNQVQAYFPQGAEPLRNEVGTAPGIWFEVPRADGTPSLFIAMPGVPSEMRWFFDNQIQQRLLKRYSGFTGIMLERKINTFGLGEAAVEEKLLDLTRRDHIPEVGITASDATISLRIIAKGTRVEEVEAQIAPVERTIRERLGKLVFGTGKDELQHAVATLLREKKKTIAVAESLTGGLVMERLCQVPGISEFFLGGCVAYSNQAKVTQLGVAAELIESHGAVSPEVAEAMATGARDRYHSDLAVSTTGIAGPGGATATKPVGLAYIGMAWEKGVAHFQVNWSGDRMEVMSRTSKAALNAVRLHLLD